MMRSVRIEVSAIALQAYASVKSHDLKVLLVSANPVQMLAMGVGDVKIWSHEPKQCIIRFLKVHNTPGILGIMHLLKTRARALCTRMIPIGIRR